MVNRALAGNLFAPTYTPSPAVRQIVQAAPVARNVVREPVPVAQQRTPSPQPSALRSNPVVQELLSRAIQYYSPPQRQVQPVVQPVFRQATPAVAQQHLLQPGGYDVGAQNALYDLDQVQYQIARAQDANRGEMTSMGFQNDPTAAGRLLQLRGIEDDTIAREQQRLQQQRASNETRALIAFPQMTRQEIGNLSDQRLDALLALAPTAPTYNPLSGPKAGSPTPPPTTQDLQLGDLGIQMAQLQQQMQQSGPYPNPGLQARIGQTAGEVERLSGQPALQADNEGVLAGLQDIANVFGPAVGTAVDAVTVSPSEAGALIPDTVVDTAVDAGQSAYGVVDGPLKSAYEAFKGIAVPVTDRVKWSLVFGAGLVADNLAKIDYLEQHAPEVRGAFEALSQEAGKPWREMLVDAMNVLDEPRQYNVAEMGDLFYQNATGTREYDGRVSGAVEVGGYHPLGMTPYDIAYEVLAQFVGKDELNTLITDAYSNGYSSPSYLQAQTEAGIPPDQQQPQFTGGRAVWEALVGQLDGLTTAQRLVVLGLLDTVMDPLTYMGVVAGAGEKVAEAGRALRGSDSLIAKGAGVAAEATGLTIKTAAELPDAPFIVGGHLAGQALRATGNLGGLLSESTRSLRSGAEADMDTYTRTLDGAAAPAGTGAAPVASAPVSETARTRAPKRPVGPIAGPAIPSEPTTRPVPRRPRGAGVPASPTETPTPASVVEETAAEHGVTLTTGAPPPSASPSEPVSDLGPSEPKRGEGSIRDPYPELTRAEARTSDTPERHDTWRGIGTKRATPTAERDTPLSASTGGNQGFLDELATDAAALPNTVENRPVKQQANDVLQAVTDGPGRALTSDPFYRNFNEGGVRLDVPPNALTTDVLAAVNDSFPNVYIGDSRVPGGAEALAAHQAPGVTVLDLANPKEAQQAYNRLNSLAKGNLERLAEMQGRVDAAAIYRASYGEAPRGAIIPEPVRNLTPDGVKQSYTRESADWLAWRYITTGDETDARKIANILTGNQRLFDTTSGRPVATRYPTKALTDEALLRLQQARGRYQFVLHGSDELWRDPSILKRVLDAALGRPVHFAHPGVMALPGLGLRSRSRAMTDWFRHLDTLASRMADSTEVQIADSWLKTLYAGHAIDAETAAYGDRLIVYTPDVEYSGLAAGMPGALSVQEALEFVSWREADDARRLAAMTPSKRAKAVPFDAAAERRKIAHAAAGLAPATKPASALGRTAWRALRAYDKGMSFYRNAKLANLVTGIGGAINDIIGTAFAKMISGNATWRDINMLMPWRLGYLNEVYRKLGRDEIEFGTTILSQYAKDTGMVIPSELLPGLRGMEDVRGGLPPINAAVANKPWLVRAAANLASIPYWLDLRRVSETMSRVSIWEQIARHDLDDSLKSHGAFWLKVNEKLPGDATNTIGKIREEARARAGKQWNGGVSPADVYRATGDHDLTRAWQSEMNLASKHGVTESHRVNFSGTTTKSDELARRAFTFHYWQSRASIFHLRTATRNPILLNTYWKLWQDIQGRAEGLPRGLQSMVKVFTSGQGISAAINGFGYLLPMTALDMADQDGNKFAQLFHLVAPMLQGILAAGGADYSPNVDPFRGTEKLLVAILNQAKVDGVPLDEIPIIGPHINTDTLTSTHFTEDTINAIVAEVNGKARDLLAKIGVSIGEFQPFDRGAYDYDLGVSAVQQVMEGMYGPRETWAGQPNGEQIMADYEAAVIAYGSGSDGNPIAQQAQAIVSEQQLVSAGGNALLPGTVAWSDWRQETMTDQAAAIAALENGNQLTPAQQGALDNRQDTKGTDILWNAVSDAYHRIGTPEQQDLYGTAQMVLNNSPELAQSLIPAYKADGTKVLISGYQLANMTDQERVAWVESWLKTWPNGVQQYQQYDQDRKDFLATHPEYQDYKTYQGAVYDDPRGFRTGLAQTDPNYQRAMETERDRLEAQGLKGETLEQELDDWAKGEAAYRAAIGQKVNQKDPDPLAVYDPTSDVTQNPNWPQQQASKPPKSGTSYGDSGLFRADFGEEITSDPDQREAQLYKLLGTNPGNKDVQQQIGAIEKPADLAELNDAVTAWQQQNQINEQLYGDAWNDQTGEWEAWASTEKKRTAAGLPAWVPFPPKSDMLQTYWWWSQTYGSTDINRFIDWWYQNRDRPEFSQAA